MAKADTPRTPRRGKSVVSISVWTNSLDEIERICRKTGETRSRVFSDLIDEALANRGGFKPPATLKTSVPPASRRVRREVS